MGSLCPLEKYSSPSAVASTGISLFFYCLGAFGSSWLEHWLCVYFTSCSLTLAPSPSDPIKCSSCAAAFRLIIHRNHFYAAGLWWQGGSGSPDLSPSPVGRAEIPRQLQACVGLLPVEVISEIWQRAWLSDRLLSFFFWGIRISWSDPLSASCVSNQWDCSRAGVLYKPINAHLCCSIYLCFKGLLWKFEKTSLLWQLMY